MSVTDENGNDIYTLKGNDICRMQFPGKYINNMSAELWTAVASQTKAIHLSYTFDDGTTASTVLSLA